jgi:hypothetical protein
LLQLLLVFNWCCWFKWFWSTTALICWLWYLRSFFLTGYLSYFSYTWGCNHTIIFHAPYSLQLINTYSFYITIFTISSFLYYYLSYYL